MRTMCGLLVVVFLSAAQLGCNKSPTGGTDNRTFNMTGPATSSNITQGETETVTIAIKPSRNFHESVKLQAAPLKDGLKPTLEQKEIKLDGHNQDVKLTVTADPSAPEGKNGVRITATPEKGAATTLEVDFNVKTRSQARFEMTGPSSTTNVSQGESNHVTLALKPSREFTQPVKLQAKATEKGIHVQLEENQINLAGHNKDVKLTVSADKDAAPGKRIVIVTATPADGNTKELELNFNVEEHRDSNVQQTSGTTEDRTNGKANFDMTGPSGTTTVKQGESNYVTLALKPGRDYNATVKLDAKGGDGLKCTLEQNEVKLAGHNKDIKLTVLAMPNATAGRHSVRITATPDHGNAKVLDLNFEVKERK